MVKTLAPAVAVLLLATACGLTGTIEERQAERAGVANTETGEAAAESDPTAVDVESSAAEPGEQAQAETPQGPVAPPADDSAGQIMRIATARVVDRCFALWFELRVEAVSANESPTLEAANAANASCEAATAFLTYDQAAVDTDTPLNDVAAKVTGVSEAVEFFEASCAAGDCLLLAAGQTAVLDLADNVLLDGDPIGFETLSVRAPAVADFEGLAYENGFVPASPAANSIIED